MGNIVMLTGSPREGGNSSALADSFAAEAVRSGLHIERFDTGYMNIRGCLACDTCFSKGRPCAIDDDFNKIARSLIAADGIVFVSPIYWYGFPSQLKSVFDRLYCFVTDEQDFTGKKSALISCCGDTDIKTFTAVKFIYEKSMELMNCSSVGEVLVPGVSDAGAVESTDGIRRSAELVRSFM